MTTRLGIKIYGGPNYIKIVRRFMRSGVLSSKSTDIRVRVGGVRAVSDGKRRSRNRERRCIR
jgi:hypothetical protein